MYDAKISTVQMHLSQCSEDLDFSRLLSGCPNLENLEAIDTLVNFEGKFIRFPKLVRAYIHGDAVPLEIVKNVEVLFIYWVITMFRGKLDLYFHNLVELELTYLWSIIIKWSWIFETLDHTPKLQSLTICYSKGCFGSFDKDEPVPECISLYLKRCCLKGYIGSIDETVFARYIM
ncbi:hypothetical protein DEO72_LG7g1155 [Vigna unguiculata]|uniref:FBD domain-containing protein n=1 Tax=Vigna unguiculata TaxID=3917 RepID=A0A4D6MI21_VIGUN|nr:hypothetical protein DEO72_LG7g1155 [Vigna unguiculata]